MNRIGFLYILVFILVMLQLVSFFMHEKPKQIISVDIESLFKEFVVETAERKTSEEDASREVDIFARSLERFRQKLAQLAEEKNFVILDKKSVLGGGTDQTEQARVLLDHIRNNIKGEEG